MKKILLIFISVLLNQACAQKKIAQTQNNPCAKTKLFEVTKEFSKNNDKPKVHFSAEIPQCLTLKPAIPGQKSFAYAKIEKHDKNGVLTQMLTFNYIELSSSENFEEKSLDYLWQLRNVLIGAGFVFEESESLVKKFDGKEYPLFQAIGELKNNPNSEYKGRYWIKSVVVKNPYGNTNVLFYMIAKEDQNINHYQDFADKLTISKIWQTFKYLEE